MGRFVDNRNLAGSRNERFLRGVGIGWGRPLKQRKCLL